MEFLVFVSDSLILLDCDLKGVLSYHAKQHFSISSVFNSGGVLALFGSVYHNTPNLAQKGPFL